VSFPSEDLAHAPHADFPGLVIFGLLYAALPDFPPKTKGISYPQMLWSMATYIVKYPTLVQCCILGFLSSGKLKSAQAGVCAALTSPFYSLLHELVE
jgi:hypothetical protein